jgi:hypothetical protein
MVLFGLSVGCQARLIPSPAKRQRELPLQKPPAPFADRPPQRRFTFDQGSDAAHGEVAFRVGTGFHITGNESAQVA